MSHNPSAKRNRHFRSGETRGRRQVSGLATAMTPLPGPPTANADIVDALPLGGSTTAAPRSKGGAGGRTGGAPGAGGQPGKPGQPGQPRR